MGRKKSKERLGKQQSVRKKKNLPPCRVCGAVAAGFHYGVNTCEACKGFFHRSLRFYKQYVCDKDGTCLIQYGLKKMCQKCRHVKCVSVGMAKDAIKTGRYTTSKHTNDTLELKRLKFKTMLERRSKSQGLFSRALASCPLSQGFIYENMRKNMETKDPCQSADSGVCCNQDRISFRCLNNLNSCPTIKLLHRQAGGSKSWFLQSLTSSSIQFEPVCLEDCADSDTGLIERKRILERCSKLPKSDLENSLSSGSSKMTQGSGHLVKCSKTSSCPSAVENLPLNISPFFLAQSSDNSKMKMTSKTQDPTVSCSTSCAYSPDSLCDSRSSTNSPYCMPVVDQQTPYLHTHSCSTCHSPSNCGCFVNHAAVESCQDCQYSAWQHKSTSTSKAHTHSNSNLVEQETNSGMAIPVSISCEFKEDEIKIEELYRDKNQVVCTLKEAFQKHIEPRIVNLPQDELDRKAAEHLEVCKLRKEMFGHRSRIPDSEYDLMFASTGIDFDNRLPRFNSYVQVAENMVRDTVKFSKLIPGFRKLPIPVKINLIKLSAPDLVTMDVYKNISTKHSVSYCADGTFLSMDDMVMDYPEENQKHIKNFFNAHIKISKALQEFCFTKEEEIVFRAILIMTPDRDLWSPGESARTIYEQLHECMLYLLEKREGNAMMHYAKFIHLLAEMRLYHYNLTNIIKRMGLHKYSRLLENPILRQTMAGILFNEEDTGEDNDDPFMEYISL